MMWELELLQFQKTGWITGQDHPTLGRIISINNVLSKFKGIGQGLKSVPQARPRSYHGWAIPLMIHGRTSLCRIKHWVVATQLALGDQSFMQTRIYKFKISCCHTTFHFKLPTGSLYTFSRKTCKQYKCCSPELLACYISTGFNCPSQPGNKAVITFIL